MHTQGTWRIGDAGNTIFGPKKPDGSLAAIIASIGSADRDVAAKRANARLIAAAPELLGALKAVAAKAEHCPSVVDALGFQNIREIRTIIAKAES